MRNHHHHPYRSLKEWHAGQREQRKRARWIPYSLRWEGGGFLRIFPQIIVSGIFAALICLGLEFKGDEHMLHSPILFPVFGFVVGLAITFRMQSSYSRWWDGRTQWDRVSAVSRSFARTLWLHVPDIPVTPESRETIMRKEQVIRCVHTLAVALKHHLRGEREWHECHDLKHGVDHVPNYNLTATNHPLTLTLHLSTAIESYRTLGHPQIDTQVLTHLLTHIDTLTSILSACERLLRTPIPLGYNIAISRIVWIFIFTLPGQLWAELRWWSVAVTGVTAYALFALAEVGLEIENPWGEGPNDLDLDRYCNLLALDLDEIMAFPRAGKATESIASSSSTISLRAGHGRERFGDLVDVGVGEEAV
ncbi:Bestrophin/UPF0187 [Leptodontidium sp. 2 PMI_412]|nr:Bestrophin/UPF0187 [Leptodontidium sp. 2 PMI_412]